MATLYGISPLFKIMRIPLYTPNSSSQKAHTGIYVPRSLKKRGDLCPTQKIIICWGNRIKSLSIPSRESKESKTKKAAVFFPPVGYPPNKGIITKAKKSSTVKKYPSLICSFSFLSRCLSLQQQSLLLYITL